MQWKFFNQNNQNVDFVWFYFNLTQNVYLFEKKLIFSENFSIKFLNNLSVININININIAFIGQIDFDKFIN